MENKINILSSNSIKNELYSEDSYIFSNFNDSIIIPLKNNNDNFSFHTYTYNFPELSEQNLDKYGIITFIKNNNQILQKDINLSYINSSDINSGPKKDNNQLKDQYNKITPFNYDFYKNNYKEFKQYKFEEPEFISINEISDNYKEEISKLWDDKTKIFNNELDLKNTVKNGKICRNSEKFLTVNYKLNNEKRRFHPYQMITKIKTAFNKSIRDYINSFKEMEYKISKIKKNLINNKINSDFNLTYLMKPLSTILSNESNETNKKSNYDIILFITASYNINKNYSTLKKQLSLTVQEYLDIFRYKKPNNQFKIKLIDYLIKEIKNIKMKLKIKNVNIV